MLVCQALKQMLGPQLNKFSNHLVEETDKDYLGNMVNRVKPMPRGALSRCSPPSFAVGGHPGDGAGMSRSWPRSGGVAWTEGSQLEVCFG